ncbi:MAG TPA: tRNA (adenosine(37)-N6)-dimethylallyltransferase MiaA [Chitinophagaceae bacterium]|nr:tRNA (adenosine(37)-N6)-dimethylallyltransferase MiaA [Chitinophagaceae bacterium]
MTGANKTVIIVAGPTAAGKTSVGIDLAKRFDTAIISADSRQCYREMNIGVARPSAAELEEVPHYFIASHSVQDNVSAAVFGQYALEKVNHIFLKKDVAVMVGGTGLYIRAFCEGMDEIPGIPSSIRDMLQQQYDHHGLEWLRQQLQEKDPQAHLFKEIQNPQRVMRALEVVMATGKSILDFQKGEKTARPFRVIKTALTLPRPELYERINQRVVSMMEKGLLDEVRQLQPFRNLNALQTVGYQELFDYLDGNISLAEAVAQIQQNTRRYAKRQLTWFRKDEAYSWFSPGQVQEMYRHCLHKMSETG